jgi:hypothetical protein
MHTRQEPPSAAPFSPWSHLGRSLSLGEQLPTWPTFERLQREHDDLVAYSLGALAQKVEAVQQRRRVVVEKGAEMPADFAGLVEARPRCREGGSITSGLPR